MIPRFDKATEKWFKEHPLSETTIMQCDKCGLFYKPILGHECESIRITSLKNKCGSCIFSKSTNWGSKPSKTYVECTNKEHIEKYCKSALSRKRAKTTPACKKYKERKEERSDGNKRKAN